ncbi:MAG: LysR family transcriptional regulator [Anaerovoracaceae bacterium]|jgi:DNA-binding transcriptional LysR family regulator
MNVSQYEAFVKTVEEGSLTRAAEKLGYTQSGVTHMLDALESQFGVKLLYRNHSGVRLTSDGKILLPHIQAVLYQQYALDERVREIKGLSAGLIRIGTFTSVSSHWLPGMIRLFQEKYPEIDFELLHGTNDENEEWVRTGRVDLAFVRIPQAAELQGVDLFTDPIVAIVAENSPYAKRKKFPLKMLKDLPYIELSEGVDDEITEILKRNDIKTRTRFVERDDYAVIAMVEQGLGVSIMPGLVLRGTERHIRKLPLDPPGSRELGIAFKSRDMLSNAARAFIRCAETWIRENRDGEKA